MRKEIIVNANKDRARIAIVEDGQLVELYVENPDNVRTLGNIVLAKVQKVKPEIKAAFVDIGQKQDAFLHFSDLTDNLPALLSLAGEDIPGLDIPVLQTRPKKRVADDESEADVEEALEVADTSPDESTPQSRRRRRRRGGSGRTGSGRRRREEEEEQEERPRPGFRVLDLTGGSGKSAAKREEPKPAARKPDAGAVSASPDASAAPAAEEKAPRARRAKKAAEPPATEPAGAASEPAEAPASGRSRTRKARSTAPEAATEVASDAQETPTRSRRRKSAAEKAEDTAPAEQPAADEKPKRNRRRKTASEKADEASEPQAEAAALAETKAEKPARSRRKKADAPDAPSAQADAEATADASVAEDKPARGRRRTSRAAEADQPEAEAKPRSRRRSRTPDEPADGTSTDADAAGTSADEQAPADAPAPTALAETPKAPAHDGDAAADEQQKPRGRRQRRQRRSRSEDAASSETTGAQPNARAADTRQEPSREDHANERPSDADADDGRGRRGRRSQRDNADNEPRADRPAAEQDAGDEQDRGRRSRRGQSRSGDQDRAPHDTSDASTRDERTSRPADASDESREDGGRRRGRRSRGGRSRQDETNAAGSREHNATDADSDRSNETRTGEPRSDSDRSGSDRSGSDRSGRDSRRSGRGRGRDRSETDTDSPADEPQRRDDGRGGRARSGNQDISPSTGPINLTPSGPQKPPHEYLRRGQAIPVKITKEPISAKGSRVSTDTSLAGRFLVLVPLAEYVAVSKKIESSKERRRLKTLATSLKPDGFGVIVRTVAAGRDAKSLDTDLRLLLDKWRKIEKQLRSGQKPPHTLYEDVNMVSSILRDLFSEDYDRILIDDPALFQKVRAYVQAVAPQMVDAVQPYRGNVGVFRSAGIEKQVEEAFSTRVNLRSGGYLFIETTEAMHVVDVNSGRSGRGKSQVENMLAVNIESAREVAKQLRLRDLGGIIVVDFIDMRSESHRKQITDALKEEFKKDRAVTKFLPMSDFGLVQITRQRLRPSITAGDADGTEAQEAAGAAEITPSNGQFRGIDDSAIVSDASVAIEQPKPTPREEAAPAAAPSGPRPTLGDLVGQVEAWLKRYRAEVDEKFRHRPLLLRVHPLLASHLQRGLPSRLLRWRLQMPTPKLKLDLSESMDPLTFEVLDEKSERPLTKKYQA